MRLGAAFVPRMQLEAEQFLSKALYDPGAEVAEMHCNLQSNKPCEPAAKRLKVADQEAA